MKKLMLICLVIGQAACKPTPSSDPMAVYLEQNGYWALVTNPPLRRIGLEWPLRDGTLLYPETNRPPAFLVQECTENEVMGLVCLGTERTGAEFRLSRAKITNYYCALE